MGIPIEPDGPNLEDEGGLGEEELKRLLAAFMSGEGDDYDVNLTQISGSDNLNSTTGISIISLNRTARFGEEPRLFADENGQLADWRDRFERPGHIFESGERVVVPAFVELDQDGNISLVADDQDGRMADKFHLVDLDEETRQTLMQHQGTAIGGIVNVYGVRDLDFQLSDIHEYDVSLENNLLIPPVNPTEEQVANLPKGYRVTMAGRVIDQGVDIVPSRWNSQEKKAYIVIEAEDGRQIKIPSWRDKPLAFKGGYLANLRGKPIESGEVVRMTGYIQDSGDSKFIHAHWSEPYLEEATENRLEEYRTLRESVSRMTWRMSEMIEQGEYGAARNHFAMLRTLELLPAEGLQIMSLRESMPEKDRPIYDGYTDGRHGWAKDLDAAYDTLIESMTKTEYMDFVRKVAIGEVVESGKHCDASYVYLIMTDNEIDAETWVATLSEAIDSRLAILEGLPDDHEQTFQHSYMLEQTLGYLSSVADVRATTKIIDVVRYCMDHEYFDHRHDRPKDWGCPSKFLSLLFKSTETLVRSLEADPGNINAIQDLEELSKWRDQLLNYPQYNGFEIDHLNQVLDMFSLR